ncbi:GNAT family N-acetyltransferase [Pseudozobellia thermophila]|uniref:Acetyltransferase (GNAT) domain-containing protein n=1 Tax=Pseudozobellia thermophila TaxID=192903 RepID=A0A1M6LBZ7_9FLAO|nr:GNAT family N-acetyltransferase [Pseudozobellia thermophila]SHJ68750.1 Acetyltransferase (GNAT) domain-containing protein [Pseudozobellia thermophila]
MSLDIIPFNPTLSPVFKDLTLEWINTYFEVEAKDMEVIENSKEAIIDKGGFIFFARYGGTIVGCFALLALENNNYELGKMAVTRAFQGRKIGQEMLSFAIDFAKKQGSNKVILYSNRTLDKALHIYRKYGFKEVEMEKHSDYKRSNIKMELNLNPKVSKSDRKSINNIETWENR